MSLVSEGRMNLASAVSMLLHDVLESLIVEKRGVLKNGVIFQQDNVPGHTVRNVSFEGINNNTVKILNI